MEIKCSRCHERLDEPGGLMFSPPGWPFGAVEKLHLCRTCWVEVRVFVITS